MCSIYNENILFTLYAIIWEKIHIDPSGNPKVLGVFPLSFLSMVMINSQGSLVGLRETQVYEGVFNQYQR